MTAATPQPSARGGGAVTCEYRELHGANVYSAESVLVGRIVCDGAYGLERPSAPLDRCAELLDALALSGAEVRARARWPLASLLRTIAEQLVRRVTCRPARLRPQLPRTPSASSCWHSSPRQRSVRAASWGRGSCPPACP